jgi:hypothetical protein
MYAKKESRNKFFTHNGDKVMYYRDCLECKLNWLANEGDKPIDERSVLIVARCPLHGEDKKPEGKESDNLVSATEP